MSKKFPNWVLALFLISTTTLTTQYFPIAMMGLTVFSLAYLTKGIRKNKDNRRVNEE
ncbi:MAG: hypothetical protein QNJ64_00120 [Crocosphaera sp.]|nr:hypothetical protein [Crocosphaera sp.]